MTEFMDVITFAKNETTGKWRSTKLGYAKPNPKGEGWDIYLDAMPIGNRLHIRPQQQKQQPAQQSGGRAPDLDDSIPFAPEFR